MRLPLSPLDLPWGIPQVRDVPRLDPLPYFQPGALLRNYGDVLYESPDLAGLRSVQDYGTALEVSEYGDALPESRTLLRRFCGVLAEPLTRVSQALDALPLQFHPGYATADWISYLLGVGGLTLPEETPIEVARLLLLHADELYPLGRPAATLLAARCMFGRPNTTVTDTDGWHVTDCEYPDGHRLMILEGLRESSQDYGSGNRDVQIRTLNFEPWMTALINATLGGYFSARAVPWPNSTEDLLTGRTL